VIDLTDRVAVVTGAGAGFGRSHALALAARGAKVVVNDVGAALDGSGASSDRADSVVEEIRRAGGTAIPEYSSVATPDGGEAIVARALAEFGRVDILVNNAGNIQIASFAKLDVRRIGEILDVHLGGAFYVTQPAYRAMLSQGDGGRIIFTVSSVPTMGNFGASVYGAAKGGIMGLISVLKLEAGRRGIKVNAIAPLGQTRMSAGVELPELEEFSTQAQSPDLVSPVVVYLASDECEFTGETWSVGNGAVARMFAGRCDGYFKHPDHEGPLTPEDVRDHVDEIRDLSGYEIPGSVTDEFRIILERYRWETGEIT
jgi:NAD(P)-dependent dehydrogenase (short-subunit alcohol dehydrogenase family)